MILKGSFVEIETVILTKEERAPQVPVDTKSVPLLMRSKGILLNSAKLGDEVVIKTITGRKDKGILKELNPAYLHHYGNFVAELLMVKEIIKVETGDLNE